jgi:hypothetical protein
MMLVGIIFAGITFFNYVELANAVNSGARELGEDGRNQGTNACTMANIALLAAAGNLNASQITNSESFQNTSDSCSVTPIKGDAGSVTAYYPCNLPIPFTKINLCPVQGGASSPVVNGVTMCPSAYCISATTTVYIE